LAGQSVGRGGVARHMARFAPVAAAVRVLDADVLPARRCCLMWGRVQPAMVLRFADPSTCSVTCFVITESPRPLAASAGQVVQCRGVGPLARAVARVGRVDDRASCELISGAPRVRPSTTPQCSLGGPLAVDGLARTTIDPSLKVRVTRPNSFKPSTWPIRAQPGSQQCAWEPVADAAPTEKAPTSRR
jgi:hypothetical protein